MQDHLTTTITLPREAAEQALDALEELVDGYGYIDYTHDEDKERDRDVVAGRAAITALRAAIEREQKAEPLSVWAIVQREVEAWSAVPQAEAAEPDVVAVACDNGNINATKHGCATLHVGDPLITLQYHREAMQNQTIGYEKTIDKLNDAIAKKDAALKACVEALKNVIDECNDGCWANAVEIAQAAITQAQEAMK